METWTILLRGINVGGKRVIRMQDLREALASMGYVDPVTYIQSGNVIVGARRHPSSRTASTIERRLTEAFGHDIRAVVLDLAGMSAIVHAVPSDWDSADRSTRYNVIFLTRRVDAGSILRTLRTKRDLERVVAGPGVLFWSAPLATLSRTEMVKASAHPAYREMTVRSLRTTLAVFDLMRARDPEAI